MAEKKEKEVMKAMRKTNISPYIGISLACMIIATYPLTLVNAQTTSNTMEKIQTDKTISIFIKELEKQGITLEHLSSELLPLFASMQFDVQKKEQSSLSLGEFSTNSLFSCRGLT
jgi:hypothetical protein